METPPSQHGPRPGRLIAARVAASLAVVLALLWADLRLLDRDPLGLSAPFGSVAVLVVHALAALPLAAVIAVRATRPSTRGVLLIACAALPTAILGTCNVGAGRLGGGAIAMLARSAWSVLFALPFAMLVAAPLLKRWASPGPFPAWLAVALAIVPPAAFAASEADGLAGRAEEAIRRRETRRALDLVARLTALGARRAIGGRELPEVLAGLSAEARGMQAYVDRTGEAAAPEVRLRRAEFLARLGRLDEARAALLPLASASIDARLLLASVDQSIGDYVASTEAYRRVLDEAGAVLAGSSTALPGPRAFEACRRAADGIAFNAIQRGRWDEAEAAYDRAMRDLPGTTPYYLYQLGLLHREAGRATRAVEALEAAAPRLPPGPRATALRHLKQLRLETPSCLIGPQPR